MTGERGTIYLIHFERPLHHARHYIGWARDVDARLAHHRRGSGARLMAAVVAAGIDYTVVATWPGTRADERRLHDRHGAAGFCPICRAERAPRPHRRGSKTGAQA